MIVLLDQQYGCWIYDDDLARLLDDGCPNDQSEEGRNECHECCGTHYSMTWEDYTCYYFCPDCGYEGHDDAVDIYGCMAAPYGYLC